MDRTPAEFKVVFAGVFTKYFKPALESIIRNLGGRVVHSGGVYTSEATHCIIDTCHERSPASFLVVGFVLSGKPVLTADYISASRKAGHFLGPERYAQFIPKYLLATVEFVKRQDGGKMFSGRKASALIRDEAKRTEIEAILHDAGAAVQTLTPRLVSDSETLGVDIILTEPLDEWPPEEQVEIRTLLASRARKNWRIVFCSYYYLHGLLRDPDGTRCRDKFDLSVINSADASLGVARAAGGVGNVSRQAQVVQRQPVPASEVVTISDDDDINENEE